MNNAASSAVKVLRDDLIEGVEELGKVFETLAQHEKDLANKEAELIKREAEVIAKDETMDARFKTRERELEASYLARVKELENREHAVSSVAKTAADRLAKIKTLEESIVTLNKATKKAEAEKREAEKAKVRLEETIKTLLMDKSAIRKDAADIYNSIADILERPDAQGPIFEALRAVYVKFLPVEDAANAETK